MVILASTSEVAGLKTSTDSDDRPCRHSPPTKFKAVSTDAIAILDSFFEARTLSLVGTQLHRKELATE
jgi:hypothetical protein